MFDMQNRGILIITKSLTRKQNKFFFRTWSDETIWEYRDKSKDEFYKSKPYYGVKGMRKISNTWIVLLCIGFTCVGVLLQILAIR